MKQRVYASFGALLYTDLSGRGDHLSADSNACLRATVAVRGAARLVFKASANLAARDSLGWAGYSAAVNSVYGSRGHDAPLLPALIAAVAVASVEGSDRIHALTDLYVRVAGAEVDDSEGVYDFLIRHRTLHIEDQLAELVKSGHIDLETVRDVADGNRVLKRLIRLIGLP